MLRAFLGKKIGMTQIYEEGGNVVPVTVIQAGPCFVTQIRTPETDGYEAVQIGFDEVKKLNKPRAGHLKNSKMVRFLREVKADNSSELAIGQQINVDIFAPGEFVDVIACPRFHRWRYYSRSGVQRHEDVWAYGRRAHHGQELGSCAG